MKWWQLTAIVCTVMANGVAQAQYPTRPVKIVVPYAAGGSVDLSVRIIAQKLSESTGQSFIVENKGGGSGVVAYQTVAASPADGYTLTAADTGYAMLPHQFAKLPWDWEKDLIPITMYGSPTWVVIASPGSGIKSLQELIAIAKANPGKLNYGSASVGSANHVITESFAKAAGIKLTHIPFKGGADALNAVMSNSIDILFTGVATAAGQIKSGRVVPLAVASSKRTPVLPDVPTTAEGGLPFEASNWFGLMAPRGTPDSVITYLQQQVAKVINAADVKEAFVSRGMEATGGMPPKDFGRVVTDEMERLRDVFQSIGIKKE